jgi:hypothetical protein
VWLPNRIELFAAELCAVAQSKQRLPARDYATALSSAGRPRAPSRAHADARVEEPRGFALRRNYAEGAPASPSFSKHALKRRVCRRSGGTGSGGKPDICGGKL